jgi:hypothetical protein
MKRANLAWRLVADVNDREAGQLDGSGLGRDE